MGRVIHFEIHADDCDRASHFYSSVFGWKIAKWNGPAEYWLVTTGPESDPGINGAIMKRQTPSPSGNEPITGYSCTIHVESVDASLTKIIKHGGSIILPKQPIPNVGWMAYAKDTEGNIFGLMSQDPQAK